MPGFLGTPTRGGKLAILNCLLWAVVAIGVATDISVLKFPALLICWPSAVLFFVSPGEPDPVTLAIVMGLNSLIWGYGVSWVLTFFRRLRETPQDTRRGFQVIMPISAEPPPNPPVDERQS